MAYRESNSSEYGVHVSQGNLGLRRRNKPWTLIKIIELIVLYPLHILWRNLFGDRMCC